MPEFEYWWLLGFPLFFGLGWMAARIDIRQIESESRALENSGRLYDDGIIDPRDTRTVLGIALSACHSQVVEGTDRFGVFRM